MEICFNQPIPVDVNTQARSIQCHYPPPFQQVAVRHAKLKGLLGHWHFEAPGGFLGQHQVGVGNLGQRVIPALDLDRQSGLIGTALTDAKLHSEIKLILKTNVIETPHDLRISPKDSRSS